MTRGKSSVRYGTVLASRRMTGVLVQLLFCSWRICKQIKKRLFFRDFIMTFSQQFWSCYSYYHFDLDKSAHKKIRTYVGWFTYVLGPPLHLKRDHQDLFAHRIIYLTVPIVYQYRTIDKPHDTNYQKFSISLISQIVKNKLNHWVEIQ